MYHYCSYPLEVLLTIPGNSSTTHHACPHPLRRFQSAIGFPDAAKECLLKRVRALGGAGWQSSADGFRTYAAASLALCNAYLQVGCGRGSKATSDMSASAL